MIGCLYICLGCLYLCVDKFHACASVCVQLRVYVHIICGHLPQDEISECVTGSADEYYSKDSITLDLDCASNDLAIEVITEIDESSKTPSNLLGHFVKHKDL